MKTSLNVGNVTLVLRQPHGASEPQLLLGLKRPKDKRDGKRKRERIGKGKWVPPGGGTEAEDKSQKHSAQRELLQETGILLPLSSFRKMGTLKGYLDGSAIPTWLVHIYCADVHDSCQFVTNEEYTTMSWFPTSKLPFDEMLEGDRKWIPRIINNEKLSIKIVANGNADKASSVIIQQIRSFN
jgi:8-oxo-dGTP pyrophosphatase MutT (NUDIX family)